MGQGKKERLVGRELRRSGHPARLHAAGPRLPKTPPTKADRTRLRVARVHQCDKAGTRTECRFPVNSSDSRTSFPPGFQLEELRGDQEVIGPDRASVQPVAVESGSVRGEAAHVPGGKLLGNRRSTKINWKSAPGN